MIKAQSAVKNIVFIVLALLVLFVVGAFFISNFGVASTDVGVSGVSLTEADCQGKCQSLLGLGFNFDTCDEFKKSSYAQDYVDNCVSVIGQCVVKTKEAGSCVIK